MLSLRVKYASHSLNRKSASTRNVKWCYVRWHHDLARRL